MKTKFVGIVSIKTDMIVNRNEITGGTGYSAPAVFVPSGTMKKFIKKNGPIDLSKYYIAELSLEDAIDFRHEQPGKLYMRSDKDIEGTSMFMGGTSGKNCYHVNGVQIFMKDQSVKNQSQSYQVTGQKNGER